MILSTIYVRYLNDAHVGRDKVWLGRIGRAASLKEQHIDIVSNEVEHGKM